MEKERGKRQRAGGGGDGGGVTAEQAVDVEMAVDSGKRSRARDEAEERDKRQRGVETELGGVRRSKRIAELMGGTEHDTEHAHKRKRHESVSQSVSDGVLPWRDK